MIKELKLLEGLDDISTDDIDPMEGIIMCGRCYDEVESKDDLYPSNCNEKPEKLIGQPIGQYHCPDCGAMVMAGIPHPTVCFRCRDRVHPNFDLPRGRIA